MDENKRLPVHVSIIMDGNGRWARERGKERIYGHAEGVESVRACVEAAVETGVRYLSLFAFSEENWGRPDSEVAFLMEMMMKSIREELPKLQENGVRLLVLGHLSRLSDSLNAAIDECVRKTAGNSGRKQYPYPDCLPELQRQMGYTAGGLETGRGNVGTSGAEGSPHGNGA